MLKNKAYMKLINVYILCFSTLILISCKESRNGNSVREINIEGISHLESNDSLWIIDLDKAKSENILYFSSLFKSIRALPLSINKDAIIGNVEKLIVHNELFLVLDRYKAKSLFVFNKNGQVIRKIGQIGGGPGEYHSIVDFTIDKENDIVYILDEKSQRISWFSITTGDYINSVRIKNDLIRSFRIQYVDKRIYTDAYMPPKFKDKSFLLREICIDSGEQLKFWLPSKQYNKGWAELHFERNNEFIQDNVRSIKYLQLFMDTVVLIEKNKISPYIVFKSKKMISQGDLEKQVNAQANERYQALFNSNKIFNINILFELNDYILFTFQKGLVQSSAVFDKKKQTTTIYNIIYDDLLYSKKAPKMIKPRFMSLNDKKLFSILQSKDISKFKQIADDGFLTSQMEKIYSKMKLCYEGNPIIFIYE